VLSRRGLLAFAVPLAAQQRLKILVAGGHPGDPECGCAGTAARYSALGHQVVLLYLNRGEGYCGGADLARCAGIRTTEAEAACRILNARPRFAGQIDGRAIVDPEHCEAFARLLTAESPDLVFTHWPVDRHPDHRALSSLTLDAWFQGGRRFALYFYEVAEDTSMFSPTDFVDISQVEPKRRAACYAHASQQPERWYPKQVEITRRRGAARGVPQAEAFARHPESREVRLP